MLPEYRKPNSRRIGEMMQKPQEDIDAFITEIKQVCVKHRLGIVGTCNNEGIYGEISIVDLDDADTCGDNSIIEHLYNFEVDR